MYLEMLLYVLMFVKNTYSLHYTVYQYIYIYEDKVGCVRTWLLKGWNVMYKSAFSRCKLPVSWVYSLENLVS